MSDNFSLSLLGQWSLWVVNDKLKVYRHSFRLPDVARRQQTHAAAARDWYFRA